MFQELYAFTALLIGLFFFLVYALRYYVSIGLILLTKHNDAKHNSLKNSLNNKNNANNTNNDSGLLKNPPRVSIHLPFYNERNVAQRILEACLRLDYPNYEIVVVDDSDDETPEIIEKFQNSSEFTEIAKNSGNLTVDELRERLKVIHRRLREGYKGGALREALRHTDPKAEYIIVFDADFIPPKDIIHQFLTYRMLLLSSPSFLSTRL